MSAVDEIWVPDDCTLPTVEQPLRMHEFDSLFATCLLEQEPVTPQLLRWSLDPEVKALARELAARESECCSFFTFSFTTGANALVVQVEVPPTQVQVLNALAARAAARMAPACL